MKSFTCTNKRSLTYRYHCAIILLKRMSAYFFITLPKAFFYSFTWRKRVNKNMKQKFVFCLPNNAIGPLALFGGYLIRYCHAWNIDYSNVVCITSEQCVNDTLENLFSRKFKILRNQQLFNSLWNGGHFFLKERVNLIPFEITQADALCQGFPLNLEFTNEENLKGKKFLEQLGVPAGQPFVCISNKDPFYWKNRNGVYKSWDKYRDSEFSTLIPSIDFIANQGFSVIRMGFYDSSCELPANCLSVMDLPESDRKFADIWLHANCHFAIVGGSGLGLIPWLFGKFILQHNAIPLNKNIYMENCLVLPKKFVDPITKKGIKVEDFLSSKQKILHTAYGKLFFESICADSFQAQELYDKNKIEIVDNTSKEIFDAVKQAFELNFDLSSLRNKAEQAVLKNKFPVGHSVRHMQGCFASPSYWLGRN